MRGSLKVGLFDGRRTAQGVVASLSRGYMYRSPEYLPDAFE